MWFTYAVHAVVDLNRGSRASLATPMRTTVDMAVYQELGVHMIELNIHVDCNGLCTSVHP